MYKRQAIRNRIVEYEKKTGEKIRRTRTSSKNQNIPIKELFIKYATENIYFFLFYFSKSVI